MSESKEKGERLQWLSFFSRFMWMTSSLPSMLNEFETKLNCRFECSDGGPVSYFLTGLKGSWLSPKNTPQDVRLVRISFTLAACVEVDLDFSRMASAGTAR